MKLIALGAILSLLVGCGGSSKPSTNSTVSHIAANNNAVTTTPYVKKRVQRMEGEPSTLRRFALATNGKLTVKQTLFTDGPLADIYVNKNISAPTRSLDISGKIIAKNTDELQGSITRSFNYKNNKKIESTTAVRALKVSEFVTNNNLTNYYSLSSDGKISEVVDGKTTPLSVIDGLSATYQNGTWTISGGDITINGDLKVDANLLINTDKLFVAGSLMVAGDLTAKGELNINTGTPFDSALVVDKNIMVDKLVTIGRVHASGAFTSNIVEITGNVEIDGDITLNGNSTINMLDNVYKSALYEAQKESKENNTTYTMVHSKLFKDVNHKNSVVLFTFVEGNYLLNEDVINTLLANGGINDFNFKTYLYGASIKYGSELYKGEGLPEYYANVAKIKKVLSKEHDGVKLENTIDTGDATLYGEFVDGDNLPIGTYLISTTQRVSIGDSVDSLVVLTDAQIATLKENLAHPENSAIEKEKQKILEDSNSSYASDGILLSDDSNNTEVNAKMHDEIDEVVSKVDTVDRVAKAESDKKERINEWVEYQELGSDIEEIEVVEVVTDDANTTQKVDKKRGWWRRLKHRVRRAFRKITLTDCHVHISKGTLSGLNDQRQSNDVWAKDVTLWNKINNYCTPTATAEVMQWIIYHRHHRGSLYENNIQSAIAISYDVPYVKKWGHKLHTSTENGTSAWQTFWRLSPNIMQTLWDHGIWNYSYTWYTSVWNRAYQHWKIKAYIGGNNPLIVHVSSGTVLEGLVGVEKKLGGSHSMPVIGWQERSYSGWCAKRIWPNKKWILVDTEFNNQRAYMRFDSRSDYWKFGALTYVYAWGR